jgi:hypothetical protein
MNSTLSVAVTILILQLVYILLKLTENLYKLYKESRDSKPASQELSSAQHGLVSPVFEEHS